VELQQVIHAGAVHGDLVAVRADLYQWPDPEN
jgi:hypothetical protein